MNKKTLLLFGGKGPEGKKNKKKTLLGKSIVIFLLQNIPRTFLTETFLVFTIHSEMED